MIVLAWARDVSVCQPRSLPMDASLEIFTTNQKVSTIGSTNHSGDFYCLSSAVVLSCLVVTQNDKGTAGFELNTRRGLL